MPDLQKVWTGTIGDLQVANGALASDRDLDSALINSLFTDRRALPDDRLPFGQDSRRGWWGDGLAETEGDRFGSRLWLLDREKQTTETLNRAREYAEEALAWMIEDGVAAAVTVTAEWVARGLLGLQIEILRPDGTRLDRRFDYAWTQLKGEQL